MSVDVVQRGSMLRGSGGRWISGEDRESQARAVGSRWSAGRRREEHRAICRPALRLATIVCLVVSVSGRDQSSSLTTSEDTIESPMTIHDELLTGEGDVRRKQIKISDSDHPHNVDSDFSSGTKQSVSSV